MDEVLETPDGYPKEDCAGLASGELVADEPQDDDAENGTAFVAVDAESRLLSPVDVPILFALDGKGEIDTVEDGPLLIGRA